MLDRCREGDLDACRELTARLGPTALRVTYLLTGSRAWSLELVSAAMIDLLVDLRRDRDVIDPQHALVADIARRWLAAMAGGEPPSVETARDAIPERADEAGRRDRTRSALARLNDHQRGVISLHFFGGLPVEPLAGVLEIPPDLVYTHLNAGRARLMRDVGLESADDLVGALSAVSLEGPRRAVWTDIEPDVRLRFAGLARRGRQLNAAVVGVAALLLLAGALLVFGWREDDDAPAIGTSPARAVIDPALGQSIPYIVLPTSTATPSADVSDTLLMSLRDAGTARTTIFEERGRRAPVLDVNAIEAAPPIVSPDGEQVFLLWYSHDEQGATGYVAAFDSGLTNELWRARIAVDSQAVAGRQPDFRMRAAVDHERLYVARHLWRSGDSIEIDVFDRESGASRETIVTTLAGFVAHDIRLLSSPGSDAVNLLAITNEAPPEIGLLQISLLSYRVPGGARTHARLLFDHPDSRVLFLYDSRHIAGSTRLFGLEHTKAYRHLAVHFFDLDTARLDPKVVLPFQPITDPMPHQKAVSHDGRWLYVLSPSSFEVAVVDLFDRKLAGVVPLDPGVIASEDVDVAYLPTREMQLSPDGRTLYAAGSHGTSPSGIWVIDVASWTIVDHWLPDSRPVELLLNGDGDTLYLREESSVIPLSSQSRLTAIDTGTGQSHVVDLEDVERFSLSSIVALYKQSYASTPSVAGQAPSNMTSTVPLATMAITVTPHTVEVDESITVDVRFVHPLTGEPVDEQRDDARYQPPTGVRATWTAAGGMPVILELARVEYGHYEGFVNLPEAGRWTLRVDAAWPRGEFFDRSMVVGTTVNVRPETNAGGDAPQDEADRG